MKKLMLPGAVLLLVICVFGFRRQHSSSDEILSYTADPAAVDIRFYWKNDKGELIGSLQDLKNFVESKKQKLVFATNAGMYMENQDPLGLFIQNQKILRKLNTGKGKGNFHMQPNGIFYITTDKKAGICRSTDYSKLKKVEFATQSGPMLLIDGAIHPGFTKGSENLNIRNGVGILPDNKILFAMSKEAINFYDFALYFKNLGCVNALYLDGFVSRTYLPEKNWIQLDGRFGVMIGITQK